MLINSFIVLKFILVIVADTVVRCETRYNTLHPSISGHSRTDTLTRTQILLILAKQIKGKDLMLFNLVKTSDEGFMQVSCMVSQRSGKLWQSQSILVKTVPLSFQTELLNHPYL